MFTTFMEQRVFILVGALSLELIGREHISVHPHQFVYTLSPHASEIIPTVFDYDGVATIVPLTEQEKEFMKTYKHDDTPLEVFGWPKRNGGVSISVPYIGSTHGKAELVREGIDVRLHATDHPAMTGLGQLLFLEIGSSGYITPTSPMTPHETAQDVGAIMHALDRVRPVIQHTYVQANSPVTEFLYARRT